MEDAWELHHFKGRLPSDPPEMIEIDTYRDRECIAFGD